MSRIPTRVHAPLLGLLLAASFTGCITDDAPDAGAPRPGPGDGTPPAADVPQAFSVSNNATGCLEAIALLFVSPETAQSALPPNYTAATPSSILGVPVPAGRGVVFFNGYTCSVAEFEGGSPYAAAEVGVLVRKPDFGPEHPLEDVSFDIYQVVQYTSGLRQLDVLNAVGFTAIPAAIEPAIGSTPVGSSSGGVVVSDIDGEAYAFSFEAGPAAPIDGTARFYHESAAGTAYFAYLVDDVPLGGGAVTTCTIREGSPVAELAGTTTCAPGEAAVLVWPAQAWTSSFNWLPGVYALG